VCKIPQENNPYLGEEQIDRGNNDKLQQLFAIKA
jgi:hypothetical protein